MFDLIITQHFEKGKRDTKKTSGGLAFVFRVLDDSARDKNGEAKDDCAPDACEEDLLEFRTLVRNVDGGDEEWNVSGDEDRDSAPPWVDPDEGRGSGEEDLEDGI